VSKVKVNENMKSERSKEVRTALSRQADEELAKMSFINYQAHLHMMEGSKSRSETNEGQGQKTDCDSLEKYLSDNLKDKASVSKVLSAHVQAQSTDRKKGCPNFSSGLENKQGISGMSPLCVDLRLGNLLTDSVPQSSKLQSQGTDSDDYLAKFDRNLDIASRQGHHKVNCDITKVNKGKSDSSCGSDTLTDIGSLLNSTPLKKGSKKLQTNIPHYHPAWSCDTSQSTNHRVSIKRTKQKSANLMSMFDRNDVWNEESEMSEFASSLMYESRHRRDFVDSPPDIDNCKKGNRKNHDKFINTDLSDSPKRSSRSHQHRSNRNMKQSDGKHIHRKLADVDDIVSDSSKENIPDFDTEKVLSRPDVTGCGKSKGGGKSSQRNMFSKEWVGDKDGINDLQLVPERDTTVVKALTRKTSKDSESR